MYREFLFNRSFYSCELSYLAFECKRRSAKVTLLCFLPSPPKKSDICICQNTVISSLAAIQRPGHCNRFPGKPGSRIGDRGSRIEDRGSRIEDRGSRIDDQRSRIEDQGLRIEDRESRIEDRIKKRAMKSQKFVAGLLYSRCCYRLGSLVILQHLF